MVTTLVNPDDPLFGRMYLMHRDSSAGVQWKGEVNEDTVAKELLQLDNAFLESVDLYLFKRVCQCEFLHSVLS